MRRTTSLKAVLCPLLSILVLVGLLMGFSAREYQLSAQTFQIEVDSVDVPQPVPTDTAPRQSLTITGKGFVSDSKVVLISPSKTRYPIPKDRYFFVSSSEILVYAGVGPGTWNAEVENPDGNKSDCEFTVQSVPNPGVAVDGHLLDRISTLIEEDDEGIYYRDTWQISKDQYKAWMPP